MPPNRRHFSERKLFLCVLALLVSNTAAGFASRLARGLAFAATAVLCAFAKVASFDSLDMFHNRKPPSSKFTPYIIAHFFAKVNIKRDIFNDFCNFF
jgi:hypothetical protein